jgi:hypothetical protein
VFVKTVVLRDRKQLVAIALSSFALKINIIFKTQVFLESLSVIQQHKGSSVFQNCCLNPKETGNNFLQLHSLQLP